jgi:enoyl-CoA hydratase/carnithine racemase
MSDVAVTTRGSVAHLTLSRPKALNALTLPMVRDITAALKAAAADPAVHCILVDGEGERAFCAGGDVRAVYDAGLAGPTAGEVPLTDAFFREEYVMNAAIAGSPKPQVSVWDGFVMGGGVGVSVHGAYRVATERAAFAMPETGIGLFPDVGGSHFLSRLPGALGQYIGLTGARQKAADMVYCGLATHFVPSAALPELADSLATCTSAADVEACLARLGASGAEESESTLAQNRAQIDEAFSAATLEEICARLERMDGDFAASTRAALGRMSPTSMKLTLRLLAQAKGETLSACLRREFRAVQRCVTPPADFFEGIRATLVDKDKSPKWSPARIADVSDAMVDEFVAPLDGTPELAVECFPGFAEV